MKENSIDSKLEEHFRIEFKKREMRQYASMILIPLFYGIASFSFVMLEKKIGKINKPISGVMIAIVLAPVILSYINWRCPRCGMFFGKRINIEYCQNCKLKLK